jgi:hypothetical protein
MNRAVTTKSELESQISKLLDANVWEISEPASPSEVIEFIEQESGLIGLDGDEPGEVEYFDEKMLDDVQIQRLSDVGEDYNKLQNSLYASLKADFSGLVISPVEVSQGIPGVGSLFRRYLLIEIQGREEVHCYVRNVNEVSLFQEGYSGPMWEGF